MAAQEPDFFSDATVVQDPRAYLARMRAKSPVLREAYHGSLMVTGFDEAMEVLNRADGSFSSVLSVLGPIPGLPFKPEGSDIRAQLDAHRDELAWSAHLNSFDGQKHAAHRALLAPLLTYKRLQANEVYPHFRNEKGYWGVSVPTKTLEAQQSPFCLLQAPDQGLYIELDNPRLPYRLQYTFEQHPGVISTVTSLVPQQDKFSGFPVHLEFRLCHFVFAQPHSRTNLVPVLLRCYDGDWHNGLALYQQQHSTANGH